MSATAHSATSAVRRPFRVLRFTRDDELVRLLRSGDERAFEAIYDRHHRGVLAFCRHMLGSAEEAEDALQHTFIAAHRDLVDTDKPIQLKAWLYTIARNRCLSLLRARREERALEEVPEPSVDGLGAAVQRRQDLRDLLADLQRLPEDQRAALVLSELGALSHEEIGTTLGVRKDKVKALVFQARESLASSRTAREADCEEIQQQLAVLRGGSLRRTTLRRHVEVCPACAAFKAEVTRQRRALAAVLPVVPSLALKESILAAVIGGGGAAGGGGIFGGGLLVASGAKSLAAKVATIGVVAGGATGGGLVAVDEISGGGNGNTATAMESVPPEERAVRMVGDLRERAERTAHQRAQDHRAAGTRPASLPADEGSTSGTATIVAGDPRVDRAERRGRVEQVDGVERMSEGDRVPVADAPPPPPGAPPAPQQVDREPEDEEKPERDEKPEREEKPERPDRDAAKDDGRGKGKDKDREKGKDKERKKDDDRDERPAIPVRVPAVELPKVGAKERGRRGKGGERPVRRRDRGTPAPPAGTVPQPPPQPAPAPGARPDKGRGTAQGGGDGKKPKEPKGVGAVVDALLGSRPTE